MPFIAYSQTYDPDIEYDYAVKPGTAEWKSMEDRSERVESCQIPKEILSKLSTQQLLKTCLNYPFMCDIFAFNDMQKGFSKVVAEFNGLQELLKRKDNAVVILNDYAKINPDKVNDLNPGFERGSISFRMSYLEFLLNQEEVIKNMSANDEITLIEKFVDKYELKRANNYYQGRHSYIILANSLKKALAISKATDTGISRNQILRTSTFENDLNPDSVIVEAKEYLYKLKINRQ